ncbi:MAG: A/G-specific adenine glycosylase [Bacteroidetes bacterium]|nr:A/G-specific adenine glycosylase [Bacteroidota bacterium]
MDHIPFFRARLLQWAAEHPRPMPWKGERDPYKIWLSEIILQQTRVEQGLPYYEKFVAAYPTVTDLALAPEDELFKLWEGLGYYSRARNLHFTAKYIATALDGRFPDTYDTIRALKGVGDYTAAAIASFAYDLPHAVLDGNVYRILARFFGIDMPTDTPAAKKEFTRLAQQVLDAERPAAFNQAIMDFGATHCTPQQPRCATCPMQPHCVAFQSGRVQELPIKSKKLIKKERYFCYFIFHYKGDTWVRKRTGKDIWHGLFDFPAMESSERPNWPESRTDMEQWVRTHLFQETTLDFQVTQVSKPYRQTLTHRQVAAIFVELDLQKELPVHLPAFSEVQRVSWADLKKNIAVPRLIDWYLQDKAGTLSLF